MRKYLLVLALIASMPVSVFSQVSLRELYSCDFSKTLRVDVGSKDSTLLAGFEKIWIHFFAGTDETYVSIYNSDDFIFKVDWSSFFYYVNGQQTYLVPTDESIRKDPLRIIYKNDSDAQLLRTSPASKGYDAKAIKKQYKKTKQPVPIHFRYSFFILYNDTKILVQGWADSEYIGR